jgi:hypothetical protein
MMSKEDLEAEKLKLEIKELKKPFLRKLNLLAILIPAICILITYILNKDYLKQSLELDTKKLEIKKMQLDNEISNLQTRESNYKKSIDTLNYQMNSFKKEANDWRIKYNESIANRIKSSKINANNAPVAEALYNEALSLYNKGEFSESIKKCFEVTRITPSNDYIVAKSFILIAQNYIELRDYFQAKETLKSVIGNYVRNPDDKEDLVQKAQRILNLIDEK